ncbi:MAG: acyl-CoA dehydrogenase [Halothiobacillus sp.]|jgi:acyl-CoA dehydrogenase|nr:acyl-CoA dehydrogenase [Halothiobacillus sp.]
MAFRGLRKNLLTRSIFGWAKSALPTLSDTEREALDAGDVWWDAELFSGNPDWQKLRDTPRPELTSDEQAFLDGPVEELCAMLDDWDISWKLGDLPEEVWSFIKANKFFGMIIPKEYGGLEFSAYAHSEVVRKISTRSAVAAVTVMVPNWLGPGELLMQFGTEAQRKKWLPGLADGSEIPCFGLTSPEAGSDAAAMEDYGEICHGKFEGKDVLGIRLSWHKRYITLGPVASVLGLAFKLSDPEGLVGEKGDLGITVALVPTELKGVDIGRRHLPSMQMFQNGPNWGRDVFIPMDYVIGGEKQLGKGWAMLMSALAAGRGISLPSLSAAGAAFTAHTTGAYSRVRQQFQVPIGKFEGVQVRLAQLVGRAYLLDGARRLTCAGLDLGNKLAVASAIMKAHATNRLRESVNDAMDVHGGKAVIDGPLNYLGNLYRSVPVAITVEGANIMTRNLIIFGQGAIRCHPWLLKEMLALEKEDRTEALDEFDKAFWGHVGHSIATAGRAFIRSWSGAAIAPAPDEPKLRRYYKKMSRYAAALALASDLALLTLGGALKRKEMLSARLGDVLSELYLLSGVLKRWEDEGRHEEDLPIVQYCMETGFATIETSLDEVYRNFPSRIAAGLLRFITLPYGANRRGPSDELTRTCADLLLEPSATRDRLSADVYLGTADGDDGVSRLERAYTLVTDAAAAEKKLREAEIGDPHEGKDKGILTNEEAQLVERARMATEDAIEVDDFPPGAFGHGGPEKDNSTDSQNSKNQSKDGEARTAEKALS